MSPLAKKLHRNAFRVVREPRSKIYKEGVGVGISSVLDNLRLAEIPYPPATTERDAFYAGAGEGRRIANHYLETQQKKARS